MSPNPQVDAYTDRRQQQMLGIRYVGAINGCYSLKSRQKQGPQAATVFACRTISLSPAETVLDAPVPGQVGEEVRIKLEQFDIIAGTITRVHPGGFAMDNDVTEKERIKIAAKIDWIKKNRLRNVADKRTEKRLTLANPRGSITLGNGEEMRCFIIDISRSGAGLSAEIKPEIGVEITLGETSGKVVRYLEAGFALQFDAPLTENELEKVLRDHRPPAANGDQAARPQAAQSEAAQPETPPPQDPQPKE